MKGLSMTTRLRVLFLLLLLSLVSTVALAQVPTVLAPGAGITVAWDAPAADAGSAPTGYRFETSLPTDVPATATTATLPATVLPAEGPFLLAVRAFNATGVSGRSNALPFVRAAVPGVPTSLRVVP
jgi:hypothetical protein